MLPAFSQKKKLMQDEKILFFENDYGTEEEVKICKDDFHLYKMAWMNKNDIVKIPEWVKDTIWYQIFPDRFCSKGKHFKRFKNKNWGDENPMLYSDFFGGDLCGIIEKLEYLKDLGISGIYLNPLLKSNSNHKYNTEDYSIIDPDFGTEEDMKKLVQKAHELGIRVMVDAVFNHSGFEFAYWKDVLKNGEKSVYKDWFFVNKFPVEDLSLDTSDGRYFSFDFVRQMPKLNTNNPVVQEYFEKICVHWVADWKIDGIRFDVGNEVSHDFIKLLHRSLLSVNPELFLLGEIWTDSVQWLGADEYHSVMNYPFMNAVQRFFGNAVINKKNDLKKELEKQKKQIYDNIKEKQWIGLGEEHYYIGSWGFESKDGIMPVYSIHTEKKYHIDPNEVEQIENYLKGRKRQEEERKRQEELKRKKEEVENCLSKIYFFEGNGLSSITDDNVKSSYQKIRSEYVKERYDTITEQDIELLKEFVVFSNKIDDLSKNEMATFNQNNVEIRKVASLLCADALPIYEKEISIESKPFDDINGLNSIIDEYKNKIKMQEDFLKFAKKRQLINETENSLIEAISGNSVPLKGAMRIATGQDVADIATTVGDLSKEKKSGNKHLEKVYNEYKKSFDFSWSNNGDWAERLNTFADNQNKYLRCVSLLVEIESNDAKILEATKKLKRIKKAYSEYKETLNFETIPHSDDNKTLEEFVKFQTKVFQNINSKGEFVNDSLKKIKDLNEKKAILTK